MPTIWSILTFFPNLFKRLLCLDLYEENLKLKEEIKKYKGIENIKKELKRIGNLYCRETEDGKKSGPYCMKCQDRDDKLILLYKTKVDGTYWHCHTCSVSAILRINEVEELKKYAGSLI